VADTLPFGKDRKPDYPELPKRKGFSARDVASVFIKYEARCAKCAVKVQLDGYQIDHIVRIDAGGKHELANWQLLCIPCHKPKTKKDNWEAKKGARVRGEKGQRARRAKHGPSLKSRSTFDRPSLLFKLARSESPSKWGRAGGKKWPKRKFGSSTRKASR